MFKFRLFKIIAKIVVFLLAACLSYYTSKFVIDNNKSEQEEVLIDSLEVNNANADTIHIEDTIPEPIPVPVPDVIVLNATKPIVNYDNLYTFKASFRGNVADSYHYELWNKSNLVQKSNNGSFVNIPEGTYRLCLVSELTGENIVKPIIVRAIINIPKEPKKLISETDFQTRMLDKNDKTLNGGKKSFVTKDFRLIVVNAIALEGDFVVSDIQDVRDMIYTYNKWKSARVMELQYDQQGHVTLAKIEPVLN